jgi:hypothetical protein
MRYCMCIVVVVGIAVAMTGCWQTTTRISVRDPNQVVLEKDTYPAPITILPSGTTAASASVTTVRLFSPFHFTNHEIRAVRDSNGAMHLHCNACDEPVYPHAGVAALPLVSARGEITPTIGNVELSPNNTAVVANQDACFVTAPIDNGTACEAEVRTRLVIPWGNITQIHRHREPHRLLGKLLVGVGGFSFALGAVALTPLMSKLDTADRAGWATAMMLPGAALLSAGLWSVLTPSRDDDIVAPRSEQLNGNGGISAAR